MQDSDVSTRTLAKLTTLSYRSGELKPYLDNICEGLISVMGEGMAAVTFYKENKIRVLAVVPEEFQPQQTLEVHGHLSTYVVNNQRLLNVEDATANTQYGTPPRGYCSYLGVPLRLPSGKVVGTLCYFNKNKRHYTEEEAQSAQLFAERAAIALDNYELYQQLKQHSENLETQIEDRTRELLDAREALMHKEKLAAVGEFATRITHEIRNPLATIRLVMEYFQKKDDQRTSKRANLAANEVDRLENLLNEVLVYAKPVQINISCLSLTEWLKDFVITYDSMLQKTGQTQKLDCQGEPLVLADGDKLTQICLNLLRNASEASQENGVITWTTGISNQGGFITIHNQGSVIPTEKLAQVTEPFISGKAGGSGLGLAIVKSLVEAQHGLLKIKSDSINGTAITVTLPLAKE